MARLSHRVWACAGEPVVPLRVNSDNGLKSPTCILKTRVLSACSMNFAVPKIGIKREEALASRSSHKVARNVAFLQYRGIFDLFVASDPLPHRRIANAHAAL